MPLGGEEPAATGRHAHGPRSPCRSGRDRDSRSNTGSIAQSGQPRGSAPLTCLARFSGNAKGERLVQRNVMLALSLILALVAGCGRNGADEPTVQSIDTEHFATVRPPSGGQMVLVPAGSFLMGGRNGRPDETPHEVSVSSFYLDKFPVTQEIYETILG